MSLLATPVTAQHRIECAIDETVRRVGERWSVLVLALVADRPYGFNELDRAVEGLSRRILVRTLRTLERDGLVARDVVPGAVPRSQYMATPLGRSFLDVVVPVGTWANQHEAEIARARAAFDRAVAAEG